MTETRESSLIESELPQTLCLATVTVYGRTFCVNEKVRLGTTKLKPLWTEYFLCRNRDRISIYRAGRASRQVSAATQSKVCQRNEFRSPNPSFAYMSYITHGDNDDKALYGQFSQQSLPDIFLLLIVAKSRILQTPI